MGNSVLKDIAVVMLIAIAYYLLGTLGLTFAIPPGFATSIWPPSGLALSAGLLWGYRAIGGVFLGSFTLNLLISSGGSFSDAMNLNTLVTGASIAFGSSIQALVAFKIVKTVTQRDLDLKSFSTVVKFMIIGGPISCLISPSVGTTTLYHQDAINSDGLATTWLTWWVGNTLGVLVFAPITLCFFNPKSSLWKRRRLTVVVPLTIAFLGVAFFFQKGLEWEIQRANLVFQESADDINHAIIQRLSEYSKNVTIFESFVKLQGSINEAKFAEIADHFLRFNPGILALSWNRVLSDEQRKSFETWMKEKGSNTFEIRDKTAEGLVPADQHSNYVVVTYIEPRERNIKALGLNIYSNPKRKLAIDRAVQIKGPVTTEIISLVQGERTHDGMLLLYPVFKNRNIEEPNLTRVMGFLVVVIDIQVMVETSLQRLNKQGMDLFVIDRTPNTSEILVYSSTKENHPISYYETLSLDSENKFSTSRKFSFGARDFEIITSLKSESIMRDQSWKLWFLSLVGLLFVSLLNTLLLVISGREAVVEAAFIQKQQAEKILEKKVAERTADLEIARDIAIKSEKVKSSFLANMSHEIRTPLNGIIGLTSLLSEESFSPEKKRYIDTISSCADNLMVIVNDILDFSKIESGKLEIRKAPFRVTDTIEKCISLYKSKASEKNIEFKTDLSQLDLDVLESDESRVFQILCNLVNNAIKFSEGHPVAISAKTTSIKGDLYQLDISVVDSGIGIPKNKLATIFSSFTQADSSISRKYGGTGLGLTISKRLAELLNGDLAVVSIEGQGSNFTLSIPAKKAMISEAIDSKQRANDFSSLGLKVLVVEDNDLNRELMMVFLKKLGIEADYAINGQIAVEAVSSKPYDLIFMDMQMPVMGGIEATKKIRQIFDSDTVKIVAMTANVLPEQRHECTEAGMDDFISKPMKRKQIALAIEALFPSDRNEQVGKTV
ncbi:CHASE domain-containing protein [Pseudobacteriovorax antillogorgiicola]|uniref:histidine kinase n=1 Tax=Pseudobacteriovorax antillogorgiicola TaxID=1513793 RepID=A0A1Y6BS47_9BACT|nr:CHASE domain-containing protein [Pseudobacteriovorax antillogorgiicola]TCS54578.1 signal transduction histidine kinase [Pseudobacteriovorax antillogorgiicola]SMF17968.1 Signal transduction histidine kinase [Pseudobacteriovorax antillogorgiicola]